LATANCRQRSHAGGCCKNLYSPFVGALYAFEILLDLRQLLMDVLSKRSLVAKHGAKSGRKDFDVLRDSGNRTLMGDTCGSQPVQIFHIAGEIGFEMSGGNAADPASEAFAVDRLDLALQIHAGLFDRIRGARFSDTVEIQDPVAGI